MAVPNLPPNLIPTYHYEIVVNNSTTNSFFADNSRYKTKETIQSTIKISEIDKKYINFDKLFKKQLINYSAMNTDTVKNIFKATASLISELQFEKGSIELSNSNSIKFTLLFSGDKMLMVTKPIEKMEDIEDSDAIVYSLFINRKPIMSDASNIFDFVERFKKYLSV
jgi:hypothetical protein